MPAALLVMDAQQEIVDRLPPEVDTASALTRIGAAVSAARAAEIPVLWVVIEFRPGHPEIDPRNRLLGGVIERDALVAGRPGTGVHRALQPDTDEPVIAKRRTDAFLGTDLAVLLRARSIDEVVLAGFTTSGVMLSTYLAAVDADLNVVVLADSCTDRDPVLHTVLLERLFPTRGMVLDTASWAATLEVP